MGARCAGNHGDADREGYNMVPESGVASGVAPCHGSFRPASRDLSIDRSGKDVDTLLNIENKVHHYNRSGKDVDTLLNIENKVHHYNRSRKDVDTLLNIENKVHHYNRSGKDVYTLLNIENKVHH